MSEKEIELLEVSKRPFRGELTQPCSVWGDFLIIRVTTTTANTEVSRLALPQSDIVHHHHQDGLVYIYIYIYI